MTEFKAMADISEEAVSLATDYYPALEPTEAEPLVLFHGWGCDSRTWKPLLPALRQRHDVMAVDLPGFGQSPATEDFNLESVLARLEQVLPSRAVLVGWSLGGMLAVALAARCPERITRLITLASNVCFVAQEHWPHAMAPAVNRQFNAGFAKDPAATLRRFTGLVARGDERERELLKALRAEAPRPPANNDGWNQALALLSSLDNRTALKQLRQPGLHLYAENDALVPQAAAPAVSELNPLQRSLVISGSGHALHWSRPDQTASAMLTFLGQSDSQLDKGRVARSFSRAAPSYDKVARLQRAVGEALIKELDLWALGTPERVLDLGCGTGYFSQSLAQGATHRLGLDIAEGMLRFARRERGSDIDWLCADAEELPLADASIDVVFSSLAIQWCEQLPKLFSELHRVLRPGGWLVFSTLGEGTLRELKDAWKAVDGYVHVNRFQHQAGVDRALCSAGLAGAHWSREERVLYYDQLHDLTRELKALGAHNINRGQPEGLTSRRKVQTLKAAYEAYRRDEGLPASYEVFYCRVRKPD